MELTSEAVADRKLLGEKTSATCRKIYRDRNKIDFYDAKSKAIHEIKRSDKIEQRMNGR